MPHKLLCLLFLTLSILCTAIDCPAKTCGVILSDDRGNILYAENETIKLIPASITKILTSLTALKTLGPDYQFKTWASLNTKTNNLHIKGFGDPLFISEKIQVLTDKIIQETKIQYVHDIILDHDYFHPDIIIPGTGSSLNPYDATTGALCANFNTVFFKRDRTTDRYLSAEPQTPLLNIFQDQIRATGQARGRILLSHDQRKKYPGLLIKAFLEKKGIRVTGAVRLGTFEAASSSILEYESDFTLDRVVAKLLQFSNNFMANQLMLTMGAHASGPPATLEKGMAQIRQFARETLELKDFTLKEGSGLSRQNRFSAQQMLVILKGFMPFYDLMQKDKNEFYKTGTLSDVRTRAGYFQGKDKRLYPFVIMLNRTDPGYTEIKQKLKAMVDNKTF
ncbi:MAG: D-alanyl-D-alanine carboxypeptidase [Desulfobacter sp.]|nr:D-alanyl-D-alanine carboxypeptidase [Desulfobacter sp.]